MGHSIRTALALGILVAAAGCARNVGQHAHTGKDGRYTGAVKVPIDGTAAAATSGIVTYPGGDRVDWKLIELPAGARGSLDIELEWKTPRPGLDLASRRRAAPVARREDGMYSPYSTDEQRSQRGWIGVENDRVVHSRARRVRTCRAPAGGATHRSSSGG